MTQPKILVLAGRRSATLDPLAEAAGVSHKCLVPVAGVPMVVRVLETAAEAYPEAPLFVSIEDFSIIEDQPIVARLQAEGRLTAIEARHHIVDSIVHASGITGFPLMITTADNVLMTAEVMKDLEALGASGSADAIVVMAEKTDIRAAHPDGQRRFYELKDGGFSNCNLFWLGSDKAVRAAEVFRHGGQFAKHPGRIVKAFGVLNLIRFRWGLETLEGMFRHVSRRFGIRIVPMVARDGKVAIDVDNERTHRVAEEILAREAA